MGEWRVVSVVYGGWWPVGLAPWCSEAATSIAKEHEALTIVQPSLCFASVTHINSSTHLKVSGSFFKVLNRTNLSTD